MDRRTALALCFGFGLVMFAQYFSLHKVAHQVNQSILEYWQIIFAFTLLVGVVSFFNNNARQIRRGQDVPFRVVSLLGLSVMPLLAIGWGVTADTPFMWMFENVQMPMQSTVFALLAFFVASASFRGFRARSAPAAVLLVSALIILLSRSAIDFLPAWFDGLAGWLRSNPSMSARRAILIGIGLGSVTTSLRVIIGIERSWLGGER
ncbi:MAG: hypothetical protein ACE5FH_08735 [Candidatus Zixiibacteriota bacterium]